MHPFIFGLWEPLKWPIPALLGGVWNFIGPNQTCNDSPNCFSNHTLEEKVVNGFIIGTEIACGAPFPIPFYHVIFGEEAPFSKSHMKNFIFGGYKN